MASLYLISASVWSRLSQRLSLGDRMALSVFFRVGPGQEPEILDLAETSLLAQMRSEGQMQEPERLNWEETPSPATNSFMIAGDQGVLWMNVESGRRLRKGYEDRTHWPLEID